MTDEYKPGLHATHPTELLSGWAEPMAQDKQCVELGTALYAPAAQEKQLAVPLLPWNIPGSHAWQNPAANNEKLPALHGMQLLAPSAEKNPAKHDKHETDEALAE